MRYILKTVILLAMLIFFSKAMPHAAEIVDKIVAVVNDDVITKSELEESMHPFIADYRVRYGEENLGDKMEEARKDALNRMIEEKLILQHAIKNEMEVEDAEIEERITRVKAKFNTEEEFYSTLKESGMTISKLRNKYKDQLLMKKLISGLISLKVRVSPTQIAAYYYGHLKDFTEPNMIRFKVILLKPTPERDKEDTRKLALEIVDRINSGEDFDTLAKEYSQGPNVDKGGDMGYMAEGTMLKELEDAISELGLGETSDPIETEAGYNIVELIDSKESRTKDMEEAEDFIKERLFQREAELVLREFVGKLKKDAYISIQ
ncbi:MAG: peptidylprolyl isomerase [Candidatus Omnitrophota bacterium]